MTDPAPWRISQLTHGSDHGAFHAHAYYDIPVFDSASRRIVGHQVRFAGRQPEPDDTIEIGIVTLDGDRRWQPLGESRAWSWQQGAMSQWLPTGSRIVWNDRDGDRFVARLLDVDTGRRTTLPLSVYAIDPAGATGLSLNMARLQVLRPGYGYAGGGGARIDERRPDADGVWRIDLDGGDARLLLSLDDAVRFLLAQLPMKQRLRHAARRFTYWFNHVKFSPSGKRFTVKLRFRRIDGDWTEEQGFSLTCDRGGGDLRLLAHAASHVMWLDDTQLYFWRTGGVYLYADTAPHGRLSGRIAPDLIDDNVHIRHFPGEPDRMVFDTPYREQVDLYVLEGGRAGRIARFDHHRPARGPFRCDLHPCPSPDGRKVLVTSLQDGGRQLYLLEPGIGDPTAR